MSSDRRWTPLHGKVEATRNRQSIVYPKDEEGRAMSADEDQGEEVPEHQYPDDE
jgi:hypothetical protein